MAGKRGTGFGRRMRRLVAVAACVCALLVGACSSGDGIEVAPTAQQVTGTVFQPAGALAAAQGTGFLARLAAFFSRAAHAAITGLTPFGSVTVELVRLDAFGDVVDLLDETVAEADGRFGFEVDPPLSSTLAVQVAGQPTTMRAIVTGPVVDITPASELAVQSAAETLRGLVAFSVSEMAALTSLLRGVDIDLGGATDFAGAVDLLRAEASGLIASLIPALEETDAPGSTVLRSRNFSAIDFSLTLRDPFWLGPQGFDGGVAISGAQTTLVFGSNSDRPTFGLEFGDINHFLHDLEEVRNVAASSAFIPGRDLSEVLHVVTAGGQLLLADGERPDLDVAGVGAVRAPDGSAMFVYPLSLGVRPVEAGRIDELQASGMGVRFAAEWSVGPPAELTRLDGAYNVVQLRHALSGAASGIGSSVRATTATGVMGFDGSTPVPGNFDGEARDYGAFDYSPSALPAGEALDLTTYTVTASTDPEAALPENGLYFILPSTAFVQLRHADGDLLGFGVVDPDGELAAFSTASGGFPADAEDDGSPLAGLARRTLSVAIRQPASPPPVFEAAYNLVHYAILLAGDPGETGIVTNEIRHGRVRLDNNGNITAVGGANGILSKRSALNVAQARVEEEPAPALFASTRSESVQSGSDFTLPQADGSIERLTLNLLSDDGAQVALTGAGAVSADGSFIALAVEGTEDGVVRSQGMLFLVREP